jgi:tetratricopeptide (TPR) repeat protein
VKAETLDALSSFALFIQSEGNHEAAERLFGAVWKRSMEVRGPKHPWTVRHLKSLAMCILFQKKYPQAEVHLLEIARAHQANEAVHGTIGTFAALEELGACQLARGSCFSYPVEARTAALRSAEATFQAAYETIRKWKYTSNKGNYYARALLGLGRPLYEQHRYDNAQVCFEEATELCKEQLGSADIDTVLFISILWLLGESFHEQKKYQEAKTAYQECFRQQKAVHGETCVATLVTFNRIGTSYLEQEDFSHAREVFDEAYEGLLMTATTRKPRRPRRAWTLPWPVSMANRGGFRINLRRTSNDEFSEGLLLPTRRAGSAWERQ